MPLRKFWNALRGGAADVAADRSATARVGQGDAAQTREVVKSSGQANGQATPQTSGQASGQASDRRRVQSEAATKTVFGRSRSGSPRQSGLVKEIAAKIGPGQAVNVLEIGVGDGTRAMDVLAHLKSVAGNLRYAAIDQFEAGGGATKLMDFHRLLRSAAIRPQVFPEATVNGLAQVGRTIGGVDLIVVSLSYVESIEAIEASLSRISHPGTIVLVGDDDRWTEHRLSRTDLTESTARQAA